MLVTDGGKKVARVLCIYYPIWFQEGQEQVRVLLDSGSEVNTISPAFARKLGLKIWKTNIKVQKIDDSALEIFGMVIADYQIEDKGSRPRFFQKTFLVADTKFKVVLGILFLNISNANIAFGKETLM